MILLNKGIKDICGHRIIMLMILCLFGLSVSLPVSAQKPKKQAGRKTLY
ncbi:hypothetical protein HMPREF9296_2356 [Prevotella disiens FB035-09AN]|uniref:Uncharacterized protein n=1 Tax=Prevotella disiens FB035-09AN TaxID=866771 RepID=E1KRF7_9BACT|nr:hypothetical protein HMPREF9296_2356 [Prevotella disiens FB035-09AN]